MSKRYILRVNLIMYLLRAFLEGAITPRIRRKYGVYLPQKTARSHREHVSYSPCTYTPFIHREYTAY